MAARWLVWLTLVTTSTACTRSTAPKARLVGEIMALAGVAGIMASASTTSVWSDAKKAVVGFSIGMGVGMGIYATGELTDPAGEETELQRNQRWARILSDQARDAARDHRCADVRGLEPRVRGYDATEHDQVLLRDPAVVACLAPALTSPAALASPPAAPGSR
ncbi:MAG TPA: hypothetical protein VGC42_31030 [Kofleriaceae bacterium]